MTNTKRHGLYVVIEGAQGVGKSTQIKLLAGRLTKAGYIVRLFREPDSHTNITAREIRNITQNPFYPINTKAEVLLYNAARAQSLDTIMQARQQGIICLCDRNYLSTLAVQYYGRGDITDYDTINKIISFAVGTAEPDITVVLDATVNVLSQHAKQRDSGEKFDNLDLTFLERVRAGYLVEARKRGYPVVTATGNQQDINNAIWAILHGANQKSDKKEYTPPVVPSSISYATASVASPVTPSNGIKKYSIESISVLLRNKLVATGLLKFELGSEQPNSYYIPKSLPTSTRKQFSQYLAKIASLHAKMHTKLISSDFNNNSQAYIAITAINNVLPAATCAKLFMHASAPKLRSILQFLNAENSQESLLVAKMLVSQANQYGINAKPINHRSKGVPIGTNKMLDALDLHYSSDVEPLSLANISPRNEMDIVDDIIYENSDLSLAEISQITKDLPYKQKSALLEGYLNTNQQPPNALAKLAYSWDIITSLYTYSFFLQHSSYLKPVAQHLTPRLGYDIPPVIESAGLTEYYLDCFDLSLELYNILQTNGHLYESQYATLLGHKNRWQLSCNGREMKQLLTSPAETHTEYTALLDNMHQELLKTHPIIYTNTALNT